MNTARYSLEHFNNSAGGHHAASAGRLREQQLADGDSRADAYHAQGGLPMDIPQPDGAVSSKANGTCSPNHLDVDDWLRVPNQTPNLCHGWCKLPVSNAAIAPSPQNAIGPS